MGTPLEAAGYKVPGLRDLNVSDQESLGLVSIFSIIDILKLFTVSKNFSFLKSLKTSQAFQIKTATEK